MTRIASRTESRLEAHRRQFTDACKRGALLRIEELSPDELNLVNAEFLERCKGRSEEIEGIYSAYVETLHSWGVMCPHPMRHRMYEGWERRDTPIPFDEARWYDCLLCGSAVINR